MRPILLSSLLALAALVSSQAQSVQPSASVTRPAERPSSGPELHGFLLGAVSGRTTGFSAPSGSDFVLGEGRLRLELGGSAGSADTSFLVKGDLFHDAVDGRTGVDLREAWADHVRGPLQVRLGRQIVTWGVGDLFFINDVFPKDWDSFFSGRPMEYLKLGVDAVQVRHSGARWSVEALAIPFFTPDALPRADRFSFFDPFTGLSDRAERTPGSSTANTELALRLYGQAAGFDLSAHVYRGFWRSPGGRVDPSPAPRGVTLFYPELSVYGLSGQRACLGGVLSLETGYYDSRQDRTGFDPAIPNSQFRALAGYQRQLQDELTLGLQAYAEVIADHDAYQGSLPPGMPPQDRVRGVFSSRLTQFLDYQAWKVSLFAAYSPTDGDYFLQPEVSHKLSDSLSVAVGANLFGGGGPASALGQFAQSDNVFVTVRSDF